MTKVGGREGGKEGGKEDKGKNNVVILSHEETTKGITEGTKA